jgi:hypothetical protein
MGLYASLETNNWVDKNGYILSSNYFFVLNFNLPLKICSLDMHGSTHL